MNIFRSVDKTEQSVRHIKEQIQNAKLKNKKLRPIGANFGRSLYHNILYDDLENEVKYISLSDYQFAPYMTQNTIICHPSNKLADVFKVAHESKRMICGTPFFYEITIGGCIANGGIGGHVPSTNVPSHVVRLWVVDGNGIEHIVEGEELAYFRSTFGYLGIIYKIELNTYPEQFLEIRKVNSDCPFQHGNHVSQMVLSAESVGVDNEICDEPHELCDKSRELHNGPYDGPYDRSLFRWFEYPKKFIDIVMTPVDEPSPAEQQAMERKIIWQNVKKNMRFVAGGLLTTTSNQSVLTGFFDIFLVENHDIVNSYGLVQSFPTLPRIALQEIPLNLEAGVYVDSNPENLKKVMAIITKHYISWASEFRPCIHRVMRKVKTNDCCALDMSRKFNGVEEICSIDIGFFGPMITDHNQKLLDACLKELRPLTFGYHLGKYVSDDIIQFAKKRFAQLDPNNMMGKMKEKYDPNHLFSTTLLDKLFTQ
jgi:hypothetical protein